MLVSAAAHAAAEAWKEDLAVVIKARVAGDAKTHEQIARDARILLSELDPLLQVKQMTLEQAAAIATGLTVVPDLSSISRPVADAGPDQSVSHSTPEVQSVYNDATGGDFTLTYAGQTTTALDFDATAAEVDAALEALSNITSVTVTGAGTAGSPWLVTFINPQGNVAQMTATDTGLTGETDGTTIATVTPGANVTVTLDGTDSEGTSTLTYAWTQNSGTAVTLNDATAVQPTFPAPVAAATLVFGLVVTDASDVPSREDTVTITVT